ncbi:Flp pilus assembly protein CpaB [Octadecabacter sp. 1_MG-2023]|uniref:Flp pilus assembly protein CpaB n=1 Tax=unclassified Octadecabacter TaxID=196158 RepID=UPI001C0869F2|nr:MULTISPECIES: Flp pilus assembly protein CpaB [unclassified Octadecabacter]MBU2992002.1 Flp pilus assembly protein CpaB [Octadecabacter sp. B2R22]MDO6735976.1 Flp pilus assembly protein CpaB [Octadecabacter sp. 1_MG-2023]
MRAVFGLVLIVGMGLAGFAIYMVQGYFEQQNAALAQQRAANQLAVNTVDIYGVNRVIEHGEQIAPEDVIIIKYAEPFLPEGVFHTLEDLFPDGPDEMRVVTRQLEANEPILAVKVTEPGEVAGITALLARGMRAFAIEVDVSSGVSGFLSPGDRVDVYWTGRVDNIDGGRGGEVTKLIQANIPLVAIDQTAESGRTGATIARTVTVQVTPDQVAALAQAQATGNLSLSLVGREDDTVAGAIEVDQASLLGLIAREPEPELQAEEICTIRTRRGAEVVEIPIPCTD